MKKVLILASNPKQTASRRLDQELRDIKAGLDRARKRDDFQLDYRHAVRPRDIQRALLDVKPQIIHFAGHGEGQNGLTFEDNLGNAVPVRGDALAGLFNVFSTHVECVVLNGCYSKTQAEDIVQYIDYVIGMDGSISDVASLEFASAFYDALGTGENYEFAYEFARAAISLNVPAFSRLKTSRGILPDRENQLHSEEILVPILLKRPGLVEKPKNDASIFHTINTQISMNENPLESDVAAIQKAGEERLKVLDKRVAEIQSELQEALPESYKEGLKWLKDNQKPISMRASYHALRELPTSLMNLSEEDKEDFQWDIEKYIESIYYAVSESSFQILDEPVIGPSVDVPEAYQIAFFFIKKKIPSRLSEDITEAISERFDYLLERLFIA